MNTNSKGDLAIAKVLLIAIEKGYLVSKPLSESSRYDLVIDIDGSLKRTQVKYADGKGSHGSQGVVRVCLEKRYKNKVLLYDEKVIDLLLVYIPKIDRVCIFRPEVFSGKSNLYIRYEPSKNGQETGCLLADSCFWD